MELYEEKWRYKRKMRIRAKHFTNLDWKNWDAWTDETPQSSSFESRKEKTPEQK